jgi:hypothetical protein
MVNTAGTEILLKVALNTIKPANLRLVDSQVKSWVNTAELSRIVIGSLPLVIFDL